MGTQKNLFLKNYEIFENMQESISVFDVERDDNNKIVDLVFKYVNPITARNLGVRQEEIINISFKKLYGLEITAPYLDVINKVYNTGKGMNFETYFAPLDKYFLVSAFFLEENLYIAISFDITERKKSENRIVDSEEIFRSIVEQSIDGIMIVNESSVIIEWNHSMERITGLKRNNVINRLVWDVLYSITPQETRTTDNYNRIRKNALKFIENMESPSLGRLFEDRIQRIDGSIRFLQSLPFLIKTSKGKLICSFHRDITEYKKDEEELEKYRSTLEDLVEKRTEELTELTRSLKNEIHERKKVETRLKGSEEKYRELFNKADDMISLNEMKENGMPGNFIEINDVASQRLGYTKNELLSMSPVNIVAPDKRGEMSKNATELARNGHAKFEIVHIAKDGSRIPVEVNNHLFKLNGKDVALAISRDITEHKNTELALKESEEKLRAIIESSPDSITVTDLNLNIILCNQATVDMYGATSKDEIIGSNAFDLVDPEDRPKLIEMVKNTLLTMKSINLELNLFTKEGNIFPAELSGNVLKDAYGKPLLFIAITKDITERKRRLNDLKRLIKDLESSNDELQQFAYITSHDLQEPLRTMASYAGLLERRYKGQLDSDADEFIDYMVSGASRMRSMIQGLLDYSRVGTKGGEFNKFNVEEALNIALSNLNSAIENNNAEISYDKLPIIFADESQISRVFQNLISNAIKFRKKDEYPKIHISAQKKDNEYVFSVADNSIGMEQQYTDKIFEVFKRLHAIGEYEGAGIGLAIVKRIIDSYGGRVWVESSLGKGSTFYFTLPIKNG
jgi:PAS domain S-box-containing protein